MIATQAVLIQSTSERNRLTGSDAIRRRALERLYERRATVDDLIDSLERYQQERQRALAPCIDISVGRKCS